MTWFVGSSTARPNYCPPGYVVSHWKDEVIIAGTSVELAFVRLANVVEYEFGTIIPAIFTWFADNWRDILADVGNLAVTTFENLSDNIVAILKNLPGLIKGSVNFGDLWTPLTQGFESSLKELPNIPPRVMGDLERELDKEDNDLSQKWVEGLGKHLSDQEQTAKRVADSVKKGIKDLAKPAPVKPTLLKPDAPKLPDVTLGAILDPSTLDVTVKPKIDNKALRVGGAEAAAARFAIPKLATAGLAPVPPAAPPVPQPQPPAAPVPRTRPGSSPSRDGTAASPSARWSRHRSRRPSTT